MLFKEIFSLVENMDMSSIIEQVDSSSDEDASSDYLSFHNLDEGGAFVIDRTEDDVLMAQHIEKMTLYFKNLKRFFSSHYEVSNPTFLDVFCDTHPELMKEMDYLDYAFTHKDPMDTLDRDGRDFILGYLRKQYGSEFLQSLRSYKDIKPALDLILEKEENPVRQYLMPYLEEEVEKAQKAITQIENLAMNITPDMLLHHQMSIPYESEDMQDHVAYSIYSMEFMYEHTRYIFDYILPLFEDITPASTFIKELEDERNYYDIIYMISNLAKIYDRYEELIFDFIRGSSRSIITQKNRDVIKLSVDAQFIVLQENE